MLKRFERIGQLMLDDWNKRNSKRQEPRTRYLIPGEPGYDAEEEFSYIESTNHHLVDRRVVPATWHY